MKDRNIRRWIGFDFFQCHIGFHMKNGSLVCFFLFDFIRSRWNLMAQIKKSFVWEVRIMWLKLWKVNKVRLTSIQCCFSGRHKLGLIHFKMCLILPTLSLRQPDFSIPSYNTVTYGKHSLRYLGPRLWGKLSPGDRSAKNLNTFKNKIRKCDVSSLVDDGCKGCSLCSS